MVDKNGKLFGKVNLIDLIIVIVLIAIVAFVAVRVVNRDDGSENISQVRISFFGEETPDYVANALEVGTPILDSTENITIGTVEKFETGSPLGYDTDANGEVQQVVRQGYSSVSITAIGQGILGDHGVTINGVLYGVGHTLTIYAGKAKLYLKVSGIEPIA